MGNAARKLSPEERNYYKKLISDKKPVDGISKPNDTNLELLTDDDNVEDVEGGEYTPPDLQLVGDEDNGGGEEGNEQNQPQISQEPDEQPSEAKKSTNNDLTKLEGESDADFQQRQMNAGKIPANDYQAQQQAQQSAVPGGKSDMSDKAIRDRELKRLQETTTNIDTGKTKKNGSSLKIGATALNNRYQDLKEKFSFDALKERAKERLKKLAYEAIKKAAAAAWKSIAAATSEFWGPALLVILGVIVVAVFIVILVRSLQTPNVGGSSPVQAADIIRDKPLIDAIKALSSTTDLQSMLNNNKTELLQKISNFKTELERLRGSDPKTGPTITKLDELSALIAAYTTPDQAKFAEIKAKLLEAIKPWLVELKPGGLIFPGGKGYSARSITGRNYSSRHGGIDIGMETGTSLYAATSGTVKFLIQKYSNHPPGISHFNGGKGDAVGNDQNHGFGNIMVVEMDTPLSTPQGEAKFWEIHHISPGSAQFQVGEHVNQGDLVASSGNNGLSSGPHLHFQTDKEFCDNGMGSCNTKGSIQKTVDPGKLLGWY